MISNEFLGISLHTLVSKGAKSEGIKVNVEDIRPPSDKLYKRKKKTTKKTHIQASLWLDDHWLTLDRGSVT